MTTHAAIQHKPASRRWHRLALFIVIGKLLAISGTAQAQGFGSPDDCQAYTGDAHVKCLYAYIEAQQKRLAQIEEAIHGQSGDVDHMRPQVDRQAVLPQDISQSIADLTQASVYSYPSEAPGYAYAGYGYRDIHIISSPVVLPYRTSEISNAHLASTRSDTRTSANSSQDGKGWSSQRDPPNYAFGFAIDCCWMRCECRITLGS